MATARKFRTPEELKQFLMNETKLALEDTLKIARAKLRSFVIQDVYDAYDSPMYKRTRWLLKKGVIDYYMGNAFGRVYGGVRINKKGYPINAEKLQHSNPYPDGGFYVDAFLEMLNDENNYDNLAIDNSPFHFPYLKRRAFWEDFMEWMNDSEKGFAEVFRQKCKDRKIDLENLGKKGSNESTKSKSTPPPATSMTGTSGSESSGWHSIGQRSESRGINFNFGIGSGKSNSALSRTFDAMEKERMNFANDIEKARGDNYKQGTIGHT